MFGSRPDSLFVSAREMPVGNGNKTITIWQISLVRNDRYMINQPFLVLLTNHLFDNQNYLINNDAKEKDQRKHQYDIGEPTVSELLADPVTAIIQY